MATYTSWQQTTAIRPAVKNALALCTCRIFLRTVLALAVITGSTEVFGQQDPELPPSLRTVAVPEPTQ
jgi:hypothetical protein